MVEPRVTPDILRKLGAFSLHTRRSVMGLRQGAHRSVRRGHGVEFAEYRQYEIGDNPRYIDWNLYGRTDKLYIKRYLEEENVSLFIVIDGSLSMTHPSLKTKWEFASTLALYASYIALASQDPVVISVLGYSSSSSFWGGRAFRGIGDYLNKTGMSFSDSPKGIDVVLEARKAASRMRFPGICLVLSDFLYPTTQVAALLSAFRARNMELHAVQILGAMDLDPVRGSEGATLVDSETGEALPVSLDIEARKSYGERLAAHNRDVRKHCLSSQVQFSSTLADNSRADSCLKALNDMALFV